MSELKKAFSVKGYDQLDLIEVKSSDKGFAYQLGEGFRLTRDDDFGIGVRAVVKGKVGHAFANRYEDLPAAVKNAIKLAKYSNISIDLDKLGPYKKPARIYDAELMKREDSDFLEQIKILIAAARSEKCNAVLVANSAAEGHVHYVNSEGVDVKEKSTGFDVDWEIEHKDNPCGYWVESTRFVGDVSKEFSRTCELARLQTKKLDVKTATKPVVFHHSVIPRILTYGLLPSFSAKIVQQGKSKLAGKIGQKVFSDKITMVDKGLLAGGLGSGKFDAEGVPCQKTVMVEKGVLKGFLYDLARAKKDGVASTGNGSRGYSSTANISPTNVVFSKGQKDLVSGVDDGILLYSALNIHSIDFASGDFSIGARPAFVIKKGELVGCAKKMMLSGNVFELMKKVKSLGSDAISTTAGRGGGAVVMPSLLSECLVVGE